MIKDKETAILEAVKRAKRSQFKATAIKVELEASLSRNGEFGDSIDCHSWIMARLAKLGLAEFKRDNWVNLGSSDNETQWHPVHPLKYAEFYNDGSVDSEFTFTILLDNPRNVLLLPKVIKVFKALARANGQGMDVRGAGMHMAFLNSRDGGYPSTKAASHEIRFRNFNRSMQLLLPALFFLGSSNENSRGLPFRQPQIGYENHRSAIDYRQGALEFRVFDTCYGSPEAILDNFVVMSKCLRYWRTKKVASGLEKVTNSVRFGVDTGNRLDRFYITHTHIDLLNQGLARLKPSYYTIKDVKLQRKFGTTKNHLNKRRRLFLEMAETEYAEYAERFDKNIDMNRRYYAGNPEIMLAVEAEIERKQNIKQYISNKMRQMDGGESTGRYVLAA